MCHGISLETCMFASYCPIALLARLAHVTVVTLLDFVSKNIQLID